MKKRLCFLSRGIFLLCLMLSSVVSAQNVHIPDPVFKNYLLNNYSINTNNDSEIQLEEALAYKGSISIYDAPVIKDLTGLEAFENFTFLVVSGSLQLTNPHLDFSNFRYLMSVSIQESNLSSIKLPNNDYFERITLHKTEIENLDLSGFASLRSIMVDNNARLKTINLKGIDISKIYSAWFMLNPNLYCIQVDDIASAYPLASKKEIYTKFSLDCSQMPDVGAVLDIPNLGTKHLMLTNTQLNTNGDAEIQVSEAENYNNEELYLRDFYDFGKVANNDLSWINHF
ncbi:hypothetical protein SAMN05660477_01445 [Soonwooa buanensis]|uniref:Leucine rich repeat-containing protein n=1 Tax=Soonwooa buanensis TaxID=619805 RepID=A0A1T5EIC9_9FLAO|nr:hypothetical protein [Soonwooa buanensis]SKB83793.1 hypothetical protein SAMN05660477_01445 [Soonwooa buanensis]